MRASNVAVELIRPNPSIGVLEHELIISDFTAEGGLTIVGSESSLQAIAFAILDRFTRVEEGADR